MLKVLLPWRKLSYPFSGQYHRNVLAGEGVVYIHEGTPWMRGFVGRAGGGKPPRAVGITRQPALRNTDKELIKAGFYLLGKIYYPYNPYTDPRFI